MTDQEILNEFQETLIRILPIPEESFIDYQFTDASKKCCIIGHDTRLRSGDPFNYSLENCSDMTFSKIRTASAYYISEVYPSKRIIDVTVFRQTYTDVKNDISAINNRYSYIEKYDSIDSIKGANVAFLEDGIQYYQNKIERKKMKNKQVKELV